MTNLYSGTRHADGSTHVTVNGMPLRARTEFRKASSTAFDWGYEGRGAPAQLALEQFVRSVIRGLPRGSWSLTGAEIDAALPPGAACTIPSAPWGLTWEAETA